MIYPFSKINYLIPVLLQNTNREHAKVGKTLLTMTHWQQTSWILGCCFPFSYPSSFIFSILKEALFCIVFPALKKGCVHSFHWVIITITPWSPESPRQSQTWLPPSLASLSSSSASSSSSWPPALPLDCYRHENKRWGWMLARPAHRANVSYHSNEWQLSYLTLAS